MANSKFNFPFSSVILIPLLTQFSYSYNDLGGGPPYPQNQEHLYNNIGNIPPVGHERVTETEYFDLSYSFNNNTIFYPGQRFDNFELLRDVGPVRNVTVRGNYKYWYSSWSFCMSEHGGTHMDAPFHFNRNGWRLNQIPLNRLVDIPAAVIDVEHHVFSSIEPEQFVLQVEHIQEHESRFGRIPQGALVVVKFGWGQFWNDRLRYSGWNNRTGGQATLNFPGISGRAALWLLEERKIVGLGTDTLSPDLGSEGDGTPAVHIILLENQVYIIENIANLDYMMQKIRSRNYPGGCNLRMFVMPIKTEGTGGPTNILAYCKF